MLRRHGCVCVTVPVRTPQPRCPPAHTRLPARPRLPPQRIRGEEQQAAQSQRVPCSTTCASVLGQFRARRQLAPLASTAADPWGYFSTPPPARVWLQGRSHTRGIRRRLVALIWTLAPQGVPSYGQVDIWRRGRACVTPSHLTHGNRVRCQCVVSDARHPPRPPRAPPPAPSRGFATVRSAEAVRAVDERTGWAPHRELQSDLRRPPHCLLTSRLTPVVGTGTNRAQLIDGISLWRRRTHEPRYRRCR